MDNIEWELAACAGLDPETWFPERPWPSAIAIPMAICRGCDIRDDCNDFATENGMVGVWGAEYFPMLLSPSKQESRDLIKAKQKAASAERIRFAHTPETLAVECPSCLVPPGELCTVANPVAGLPPHPVYPHKRRTMRGRVRANAKPDDHRGEGQGHGDGHGRGNGLVQESA